LTGGLDSRILLAAVPRERRPDLRCLTLAVPGSPDVELAARLASRYSMSHDVVPLTAVGELTPAEAQRAVLEAGRLLDAGTDPVALAVLRAVEARTGASARLSGLGGEVVRGFYYVPAPLRGLTRTGRVERLARWRLFPNESVPDSVLHPRLRERRRERAVHQLQEIFATYGPSWNDATDRFYLEQRMQRWAGLLATVTCTERSVVNPMLDPRFLAIGASVPPAWKANAQFLSRILVALDPALAEIPLDGRPAPMVYARPGARGRATFAALTARKVVGKVRQRLSSTGRAPAGGATLGQRLVASWIADPDVLVGVRSLDVVDPLWLDDLLRGGDFSESAVSLVATLQVAAEVATA
ncbi:MAG: hypothetical protein JWO46_3140, partial [Nocardioidaceae bacterium]|nr:hypothetical protein [Nocardioidaceae bacterium]